MGLKKRLVVLGSFLMFRLQGVAAWGSDESGIVNKIISAIGNFFREIINGFREFFEAIINAVKWPFAQVGYMFSSVYYWCWTHLGPLGVVVFVGIAGMTAYVAIFWFKQNFKQIQNW